MPDPQVPLFPSHYYHLYNRSIAKETIFHCDRDYQYLLEKASHKLLPVTDILAYCLMPNHFHFVVQIKTATEIDNFFSSRPESAKYKHKSAVNKDYMIDLISQQFGNLFNSYAKHYNKIYSRSGSLFKKNFRRILIEETSYLLATIRYVHQNPVEAGLSPGLHDWKYSSFCAMVSDSPTQIAKKEVLELFGGVKSFLEFHKNPPSVLSLNPPGS